MPIVKINDLIDRGKYDKASELIDKTLESRLDLIVDANILKIKLEMERGNDNLALELIEEISSYSGISTLNQLKNELSRIVIHFKKENFVDINQNIDKAQDIVTLLQSDENSETRLLCVDFYNLRGMVSRGEGNYDTALEYFNQALLLLEGYEYIRLEANIIKNIAIIRQSQGEFQLAIEMYNKSLVLLNECHNYRDQALVSVDLAILLFNQRDSKKALEYLENSINTIEDYYNLSRIYFLIYYVKLSIGKVDQETLDKLIKIKDDHPENTNFINRIKLLEALTHKKGNRLREKVVAMDELKHIIEGYMDPELMIIALKSYIDLLIDELMVYNEPVVLQEIDIYITKLFAIADKNKMPLVLTETYLLRSKFNLIQQRVVKAFEDLNIASGLARTKGFNTLADEIDEMQKYLEDNISKWNALAEATSPLRERIHESKIKEYLEKVSEFINF